MSYQIHITSLAEHDLLSATDHIEFVLKNPTAANDLIDEAESIINSLNEFPERCKLVDDKVLGSWGIRYIIVNNYFAFFYIDESSQSIFIVRFLYQKSNWSAILKCGFPLV